MKKLSLKIRDNVLYVDYYIRKKNLPEDDSVTKTNIIDVDNLYFSIEYITKNQNLMKNFLKEILLGENINEIVVKDMTLSKVILFILDRSISLDKYTVLSDENLDFDNFFLLDKKLFIKEIDVYSMLPFMFEKLSSVKTRKVTTRAEILCISEFSSANKMTTHSNIYYQKELMIDHKLSKEELEELEMFFNINNNLKLISLLYYDEELIDKLINLLKRRRFKRVLIKLYYKGEENVIPFIEKINQKHEKTLKDNKIKIKVIYGKEYKRKYKLKQLNMNIFRTILMVIIAICVISVIGIQTKWKKAEKRTVDAVNKLVKEKEDILGGASYLQTAEQEETEDHLDVYFKNFKKVFDELKKINPDTIGWITVNNTKIDYPVVQAKDNEYYLKRDFYKKKSIYGWVFMDFRNSVNVLDQNTILYGHQDKHGLMFTTLNKALKKSWQQDPSNQIIEFTTTKKTYKFRVFSVYITDPSDNYIVNNYSNSDSYKKFLDSRLKKSLHDFGVTVDSDDKILTLSTCYDGPKRRVVLHAKLIN